MAEEAVVLELQLSVRRILRLQPDQEKANAACAGYRAKTGTFHLQRYRKQ